MQIVYFASVREAIGHDSEDITLPEDVKTIDDCIAWLAASDTRYAAAFAEPAKLRFALDQKMARANAPLGTAKELAIFPPVTGG